MLWVILEFIIYFYTTPPICFFVWVATGFILIKKFVPPDEVIINKRKIENPPNRRR